MAKRTGVFSYLLYTGIFMCVFLFVLGLPSTVSFVKADVYCRKKTKQMCSEIMKVPHVKRISCMDQKKDFAPVFDLYIEMDDGGKIIFRDVQYAGNVLMFKTIPRIGDFAFWTCQYDTAKKSFYSFTFDIFEEFETGIPEIGESILHRKSVIAILRGYRELFDKVCTFHIADKAFLDCLKQGKNEEAFNAFNGIVRKANSGVDCKKIMCMYECKDEYKESFFGRQAVWKECPARLQR